MTKNEFIQYLVFLSKLFNTEMPTDKEIQATWYKSFEFTHENIAKEMAQRYFKEETGRFKFAKLLEYKSAAMAGKTFKEPSGDCRMCKNTGYVVIEQKHGSRVYEMCNRCTCRHGEALPKYIKQISQFDLADRYVDWRGVFRLEEQKDPVPNIKSARDLSNWAKSF